MRLGDRDRRAAVRGEVHVVRVDHRDRCPGRAGLRVDRGDRVPDVVGGVERLHVPRRDDVLHLAAPDRERVDHLERARVDHPDVAGLRVRHVDQRLRRARRAATASRRRPRRRRCAGRSPAACRAARPRRRPPWVGPAIASGARTARRDGAGRRGPSTPPTSARPAQATASSKAAAAARRAGTSRPSQANRVPAVTGAQAAAGEVVEKPGKRLGRPGMSQVQTDDPARGHRARRCAGPRPVPGR